MVRSKILVTTLWTVLFVSPSVANEPPIQISYNKTFFGYVANVPKQLLGFNLYNLDELSASYYLEIRDTFGGITGRDNYYENISWKEAEYTFGDALLEERNEYMNWSVGLTIPFYGSFAYVSAGAVYISKYNKYRDPTYILGTDGEYWVSRDDKTKFTYSLGLIMPSDRAALQIGYNSNPMGISIGIGFAFH